MLDTCTATMYLKIFHAGENFYICKLVDFTQMTDGRAISIGKEVDEDSTRSSNRTIPPSIRIRLAVNTIPSVTCAGETLE